MPVSGRVYNFSPKHTFAHPLTRTLTRMGIDVKRVSLYFYEIGTVRRALLYTSHDSTQHLLYILRGVAVLTPSKTTASQ